jgi:Bacterial CdiA-CT RNAse A domain
MAGFSQVRGTLGAVLIVALASLIACQSPTATNNPNATAPKTGHEESRLASGPSRDLSQDETAGGHILRKHVGQTDDELRERLERERHITGASTYTDRPTAERAVGAAIAQSQSRIESWLGRTGGHANLVLDYDSPEPIGRTMNRGEDRAHPCSHALVVLKYAGPDDYYVLTSYPECR